VSYLESGATNFDILVCTQMHSLERCFGNFEAKGLILINLERPTKNKSAFFEDGHSPSVNII